jgi:hypothetical protein
MLSVIGFLSLVMLTLKFGFFGVVKLICLWTGCSEDEATKKVRNFMNRSYQISNDTTIVEEMWNAIAKIVGNKRFNDIKNLSETVVVFENRVVNGMQSFSFVVNYASEDEQQRVENILKNILKHYLQSYNLCTNVVVRWGVHSTLKMPYITLFFAQNTQQEKNLNRYLKAKQEAILKKYQVVRDEDEALND